jgi:membrane protein DedA with SNARE-associated domain
LDLQSILDTLREWPPILVYLLLFLGALIEYIVPPVPGDMLVVAGAVLVAAFDWDFLPVLAVVTLGAVIGAWLDFLLGKWLVRTGRIARLNKHAHRAIDGIAQQMKRRGAAYLAVNRFVPGLRAFFFVAAGIAGLTTRQVILWSTVSALVWNTLLVGVGYALGDNLDAVETLFARYSLVAWGLIAAIIVFLAVRAWLRSRKRKRSAGQRD